MKKRNKYLHYFIIFVNVSIISISIYLFFRYTLSPFSKERSYFHFLIYHIGSDRLYITLGTYKVDQNRIQFYSIDPEIYIKKDNTYQEFDRKTGVNHIINNIELTMDISISFYIETSTHQSHKMMDDFGGLEFFNLVSSHFPNEMIYINSKNKDYFLEGIDSIFVQEDTLFNIYINFFYQNIQFQETFHSTKLASDIYSYLKTNLFKSEFIEVFQYLISQRDEIWIEFLKSNIDYKMIRGEKKKVFLTQEGENYDRIKLKNFLIQYPTESELDIGVEIINTTMINRLAARAMVFLRTKRIEVGEFLNMKSSTVYSIIINRSGNNKKIKELKKITGIDKYQFLFDYRNSYDASILVAEDFYEKNFNTAKKSP